MAKKKKTAPTSPPLPPITLVGGVVLDPSKPLETRRITKAVEGWSTFRLDDGTTLKLRGVLVDVRRAKDQFVADGKPLYMCQMAIVTDTEAPKRLMRPKPKKAKKAKRVSK